MVSMSSWQIFLNEGGFVDTVVTGLRFPKQCWSMTYLMLLYG
jgi:hypothetical protein